MEDSTMAKAIHAMVRVLDIDRSIAFYAEAFDLGVAEQLDFEDFTLVYLRNDENDFEIELTLNKAREEPYTHGDGYGHIAVCVDDAGTERERLKQRGFNPTEVKDFHRDGRLLARFFFVQDPDGYKIEVLERGGRFQ